VPRQPGIQLGVLCGEALVALGGRQRQHFKFAAHLVLVEAFGKAAHQLHQRGMFQGQCIDRKPIHLQQLTGLHAFNEDGAGASCQQISQGAREPARRAEAAGGLLALPVHIEFAQQTAVYEEDACRHFACVQQQLVGRHLTRSGAGSDIGPSLRAQGVDAIQRLLQRLQGCCHGVVYPYWLLPCH